ncbi:MAG TPA: hypothetical protein VMY42_23050 [Thermoguttaceae bacterium]|nr:hypothetical protein [Thermoguttaceae bacterium]
MSNLYPSPENLIEIADAANTVAKALRDHWSIYGAPLDENPFQDFSVDGDAN